MKRFSLFWQIFIMIFCVLIIPTSLFSYYAMDRVSKYSEESIGVSKVDNLESLSKATEMVLNSFSRNVIQFANSASYRNLGEINSYQILNSDFEMVKTAWEAQSYLNRLFGTEKMVQSCFYISEDSDYVISTDKGICRADNYSPLDWLEEETSEKPGLSGKWVARNLYTTQETEEGKSNRNQVAVLSYVYSINPLISAKGGTIVCNIYLSKLSDFLNPSRQAQGICYVLDENNNVICHPDKALFSSGDEERKIMERISAMKLEKGHFGYEEADGRYLCAFKRSSFNNWTYVATYNQEEVMRQAKEISYSAVLMIILAVAVETILVLLISYRIFKPFRMLFNSVKENMTEKMAGKMTDKEAPRNEIYYLNDVFEKMKFEESQIHDILEKRNSDAQRLHLREMLTGTLESSEKKENLEKLFPYEHFMVLLASVDGGSDLLRKYNSDERMYYFLQIEDLFNKNLNQEGYAARAMRFRSTTCAVVLNIKTYDQRKVASFITGRMGIFKEELKKILDYTMTIGVSSVHADIDDLNECLAEATAAMKHRIIAGKDQIIFWNDRINESQRYYYPYDSENKIINYLRLKKMDAIDQELERIREQIVAIEDISYDNVVLIYQQLIGAIIKALVEEKVKIPRFLGNGRKAYTAIAEKDTIEEIEAFLKEFIQTILAYLEQSDEQKEDMKLYDRITSYLDGHYKEDIDFEEAAANMGISYSYMRRVMKEDGDISIVDYVNRLRIKEAKRLLQTTELKTQEVAEQVGYHNVQSLNRFFKKYEGTTPNAVRSLDKK